MQALSEQKEAFWQKFRELHSSGKYEELVRWLHARSFAWRGDDLQRTPPTTYSIFPFHYDPEFSLLEVPLDVLKSLVEDVELSVWREHLMGHNMYITINPLIIHTALRRALIIRLENPVEEETMKHTQRRWFDTDRFAELRHLQQAGVDLTTAPAFTIKSQRNSFNFLVFSMYRLLTVSSRLDCDGVKQMARELRLDFSSACVISPHDDTYQCNFEIWLGGVHNNNREGDEGRAVTMLLLELALGDGDQYKHDHPQPCRPSEIQRERDRPRIKDPLYGLVGLLTCCHLGDKHIIASIERLLAQRYDPLRSRLELSADSLNGFSAVLRELTPRRYCTWLRHPLASIARWRTAHAIVDLFLNATSQEAWRRAHYTVGVKSLSPTANKNYCRRACSGRWMTLAELAVRARLANPLERSGVLQLRRILGAFSVEELNQWWPAECNDHDPTREANWSQSTVGPTESLLTVLFHNDSDNHRQNATDVERNKHMHYLNLANYLTARTLLEYGYKPTEANYLYLRRRVCRKQPRGVVHPLKNLYELVRDWQLGRMRVRVSWEGMLKWLWVAHYKEDESNPFQWLPRELIHMIVQHLQRSGTSAWSLILDRSERRKQKRKRSDA